MKSFFNLILIMLFATVTAAGAQTVGLSPSVGFATSIGLAVTYTLIKPYMPTGALFMAVQTEVWTGEILKHFRHDNQFLGRIGNQDEKVKYNAIHLADLGADPEVLINNTTYPIAVSGRIDEDVVISLDKVETTNTKITHDELHALPYDKVGSVVTQHRETLQEGAAKKSAHSLCPQSDSAETPIVYTTGASNGATNARKRLTMADIIAAKGKCDDLSIPEQGRELVLCNEHVQDLLLTNQLFKEQYHNIISGKLNNLYGFVISQFVSNPKFSSTNGEKKAYGAAANPASDLPTSFFYYNKRATQAKGTVEMFYRDAKIDPENRQTVVGFKIYHLCLPKKTTGFGAIVSDIT